MSMYEYNTTSNLISEGWRLRNTQEGKKMLKKAVERLRFADGYSYRQIFTKFEIVIENITLGEFDEVLSSF